jgi:hypothetical protein
MPGVPRVLVLWSRPHHLSTEEAEQWARSEVRALLADRAIRSAQLARLESASPRHACDWNWILELDVADPVRDCVDRGACAEWLGDLRLLGMRPVVVLAGAGINLTGEDG